jgi:hypothetical protein
MSTISQPVANSSRLRVDIRSLAGGMTVSVPGGELPAESEELTCLNPGNYSRRDGDVAGCAGRQR